MAQRSREAHNAYHQAYRDKNREKIRAYKREFARQWRKKHGINNSDNRYNAKWRKLHPERANAHRLVQRALKEGTLKRHPV